MDRRSLIIAGMAAVAAGPRARATSQQPVSALSRRDRPIRDDELVNRVSDFMGVTAESAGAAVERTFKDNGRPTGYIAGEEGSGAFVFGLRYGRGLLYMKNRPTQEVFWQGPSVGFDAGGNASRVFALCYNLQYPDAIYRRFPGRRGHGLFHRRPGRELSARRRHHPGPDPRGRRPAPGRQHGLPRLQPPSRDPAVLGSKLATARRPPWRRTP